MSEPLADIRCGACSKKLGAGIFIKLELKCPRCKTINFLRVENPEPVHRECRTMDDTRDKIPTKKPKPSPHRLPEPA